jgi:hypothetical protein
VNLFSVGFGILRMADDPAQSMLTLLYGRSHSHGHPDKLAFDLYALGDRFMLDPGSIWYEQPLYRGWYYNTLAHNTMVIDEANQQMCGAKLLTFAPGRTMGIQRAATDEAYPGVTMDRSMFFTPNYVADIFGAFGQIPHKMDLAFHARGELNSTLSLQPYAVPPEKRAVGYAALIDLKSAKTDQAWTADIKTKKGTARFVSAGGTPTEVMIGGGHYGRENPPTIILRRDDTKTTVYGNAIDISGAKEPYVKSVMQDGSLEKGYGLLTVNTVKGADLCFTAFRAGTHTVGEIETDGQQAFVTRDGSNIHSMVLAGGTTLKVGDVTLTRSAPGLASIEQTESGNYLLANPSPKEAKITVKFAALNGLESHQLDGNNKRTGKANVTTENGGMTFTLAPLQQIEFAKPGAPSFVEAAEAAARKRQEARNAELAKAKAEADARSKTRQEEAAAKPAPDGTTIVIQAEDFTAEGGGEVAKVKKTAAVGEALSKFDGLGQWVEWEAQVRADGYYNLSVLYCTPEPLVTREISINGAIQEPLAPFVLEATGGYANGADDWKLVTANDPSTSKPLLVKLKQGSNKIRLTNTGGRGANLDYIMITSPDVKPTRDMAK